MSGSWEIILDIIPANLYCMVSGGYKLITVVRDERLKCTVELGTISGEEGHFAAQPKPGQ